MAGNLEMRDLVAAEGLDVVLRGALTGLEHDPGANLLAELGVGWLPWFYRQIDGRITPTSELFLGKWEYPLKPSEYLARNVRGTPLSWETDQPIAKVIDELPDEMIVFSSDFPHFEGFTDPIGHYREALKGFPEERLDRFYGGSTADVYARMGDPLT